MRKSNNNKEGCLGEKMHCKYHNYLGKVELPSNPSSYSTMGLLREMMGIMSRCAY